MTEEEFMNEALNEAAQCEEGVDPKVGAIIVKDGVIIGRGHKLKGSRHAEDVAIDDAKSNGVDLKGATLYTTLEPCSSRSGNVPPCSQLIIDSGIQRVFIGCYDNNPGIYRKGWRSLRDAGLQLKDFTPVTRSQAQDFSRTFSEYFRSGIGLEGCAKFDYSQNDGRFEIFYDETKTKSRITMWTSRGANSVYAYDGRPGNLAKALYCTEFDDIDDPDVFDYESHSQPAKEGEIVIFRNDDAHVLIKIVKVEAGPERGAENTSLKIQWSVRERDNLPES